MPVSRRRFLQNSALAALGCAAGPIFAGKAQSKPSTADPATSMIAAPGRLQFESAIGASFEVSSDNVQPVWLRLLSVNDLPTLTPVNTASMAVPPPKHSTKTTTGFLLNFSGGPAENLAQGTYTFQNSTLGKFSLFIVPDGPQQYMAVFNYV